MPKSHLGDLTREARAFGRPIAECGTKTMHGEITASHALQKSQEYRVGKRSADFVAGKHKAIVGIAICFHLLQDDERARGKRNAQFTLCLGALSRNGPRLIE